MLPANALADFGAICGDIMMQLSYEKGASVRNSNTQANSAA